MRAAATASLMTALLVAVPLAGCTADAPAPDGSSEREAAPDHGAGPAFVLPGDIELVAALSGFDACDDFLAHVQELALEQVTPWGIGGGWRGGGPLPMEGVLEMDGDTAADGASSQRAPVQGEDFSGTNVQEVGVDEPDRVKSDGTTMYVMDEDNLHVLDITGDDPVELGTLTLRDAYDAQMLLDGDRLLVTTSGFGIVPFAGERIADMSYPGGHGQTSVISLIDVGDPSSPEVTERLTLDGAVVSARLVDGVARVVIRTEQSNLPWVYPSGSGLRAERQALEANRDLIRASEAADWIPYFVHETADGTATERTLLACDRIAHPQVNAGFGMLSVLTVDVAGGGLVPGGEAVGILAGGDTVYASPERLYVATTRWVDWEGLDDRDRMRRADEVTTEIHSFDISDPATTAYVASGEVPGTLLSQWAMSEYDGRLRVASTVGDAWWTGTEPSQSVVTVLEPRDGELATIGQVDGLGLTERIYAVRFIGDVGYVVTFRETDPLYTLDLADPTDPQVTGELKITGYSAYLHPVGDRLLLGVGQDADLRGRLKGTQLSLFDVSDPADPRRIDQVTLADGTSDVEYDHRAFLHWPATGLTVVPFQRWSYDERTGREDIDTGALAFTATREGGIVAKGTLSHLPQLRRELLDRTGDGDIADDRDIELTDRDEEMGGWIWDWGWRSAISRSMVRGDRVLTLSGAGLATHDLDTLEDTGWYRFDR